MRAQSLKHNPKAPRLRFFYELLFLLTKLNFNNIIEIRFDFFSYGIWGFYRSISDVH